jgi:hypothetical protein
MKYLFIITFLLILPIVSLSQSRVETSSFYSPALGVTKVYMVYLPDGYDQSLDRYPVVYFFRNRETEWFNTSWRPNGRALKEVADDLISSGLIGPMILVGPNSGSNSGTTQYYGIINMLRPDLAPAAGIGTGLFEDYIINDLITHIDTAYKTLADRDHRGIDGFSLGGYASTTLSFRNPELFASIGAFDATLMFYNLEDPGDPGPGPDDRTWMVEPLVDPIFDVPRNVQFMLEHNIANILEVADSSILSQLKSNRYHLSTSYIDGAGNYIKNIDFVERLRQKGIRNSWGNPVLHHNSMHTYEMSDVHATASLIKHWQTFNGTKISTPTLIDFSVTESTGKDHNVIIFNYGPGPLTINSVQTNTSDFSLIDLPTFPMTIDPGTDSITFSVRFKPALNQFYYDTMYIYCDDSITPVSKTILRGQGGSFRAEPGVMYASSNNKIYRINLDTISASIIGNYNFDIGSMTELFIDPSSKELYGFYYNSSYQDINIINTRGGNAFWYQTIQCVSYVRAATMGQDGMCYLAGIDGKVYNVDIHHTYWRPQVNLVLEAGLSIYALAVNPLNGETWASVGSTGNLDQIYKINFSTGTTTFIGNTGLGKVTDDLAFDPNGNLYGFIGSGGAQDSLVMIDKITANATMLGGLGTTGIYAIAISPEPVSGLITQHDLQLPEGYNLAQNYPNPFNPITIIKYQIPHRSNVSLKVYDIIGNEIAELVNDEQEVGYYNAEFNAAKLSSGVYFYKLQAGDFVQTKKMILLK